MFENKSMKWEEKSWLQKSNSREKQLFAKFWILNLVDIKGKLE